jgi:hypothetical protein
LSDCDQIRIDVRKSTMIQSLSVFTLPVRPMTAALVLLALAACSDNPTDPADPTCTVSSVTIGGLPSNLAALEPVQLVAEIAPGSCAGTPVTWSASDGLEIDGDGQVIATHLGGPFTVTATAEGISGTAETTVTLPSPAPDGRWALAWANQSTADEYQVHANYSFSSGAAIRATRSGPGAYRVWFPELASGPGQRESVHVSAYGNGPPRRCRVRSWENDGTALVADVRCHDFAGAPADSQFDILVVPAGSVAGRHGFVVTETPEGGPIPAQSAHNSTGGRIDVTRTGEGMYQVLLGGLARENFSAEREVLHLTAYGDGTGWCRIDFWDPPQDEPEDMAVHVRCYSHEGDLQDTPFSLLLLSQGRPERRIGYVWANSTTSAGYTPSNAYNFSSAGGLNTACWAETGIKDVSWSGLARTVGSTAETNLVTAYGGTTPTYCQVGDWGSSATRFRCYSPDGSPTNSAFTAIWIE